MTEPWMEPWGHNWERYYKLQPGNIFVEAGAGPYMRYGRVAAEKVGSKGRVILIEPASRSVSLIKEGIKALGLTNITLIEKAVWHKKDRMNFLEFKPWVSKQGEAALGDEANRLIQEQPMAVPPEYYYRRHPNVEIVEVEVDTVDNVLDDLGLDHVDLFGADVENAEVGMVKGMEHWLRGKKIFHVAIAHYHDPKNFGLIKTEFERHGYKDIMDDGGVIYAHV